MDLLCIMFECEDRGVLISNGKPWSDDEIVASVGGHSDVTALSLQELLDKGALRRRGDGAVYSARMVRDEERRRKDRERQHKSREKRIQVDCHGISHGDVTHSVTPVSHPSSSSSSSSDHSPLPPKGDGGGKRTAGLVPKEKLTPEELTLMERVRGWYRRRPAEVFDEKEVKALRRVLALQTPEQDIALLESYYKAEAAPGARDYRRKDLLTLLNNWQGEIDRAQPNLLLLGAEASMDTRIRELDRRVQNHAANRMNPNGKTNPSPEEIADLRRLMEEVRKLKGGQS